MEDRVSHFNDWKNLLNSLVVCQCNLRKFDEALHTLNSLIQRIESESVPETLVSAICKATHVLISNFCRAERLDDAAMLASKVIALSIGALDTQRILAEIYDIRKLNNR